MGAGAGPEAPDLPHRLAFRPGSQPSFVIAVDVEAQASAEGEGASKRLAEQAAAAFFLAREGITVETRA